MYGCLVMVLLLERGLVVLLLLRGVDRVQTGVDVWRRRCERGLRRLHVQQGVEALRDRFVALLG